MLGGFSSITTISWSSKKLYTTIAYSTLEAYMQQISVKKVLIQGEYKVQFGSNYDTTNLYATSNHTYHNKHENKHRHLQT